MGHKNIVIAEINKDQFLMSPVIIALWESVDGAGDNTKTDLTPNVL